MLNLNQSTNNKFNMIIAVAGVSWLVHYFILKKKKKKINYETDLCILALK